MCRAPSKPLLTFSVATSPIINAATGELLKRSISSISITDNNNNNDISISSSSSSSTDTAVSAPLLFQTLNYDFAAITSFLTQPTSSSLSLSLLDKEPEAMSFDDINQNKDTDHDNSKNNTTRYASIVVETVNRTTEKQHNLPSSDRTFQTMIVEPFHPPSIHLIFRPVSISNDSSMETKMPLVPLEDTYQCYNCYSKKRSVHEQKVKTTTLTDDDETSCCSISSISSSSNSNGTTSTTNNSHHHFIYETPPSSPQPLRRNKLSKYESSSSPPPTPTLKRTMIEFDHFTTNNTNNQDLFLPYILP